MNVARGVGAFDGDLEKHDVDFVNNQLQMVQRETMTIEPRRTS